MPPPVALATPVSRSVVLAFAVTAAGSGLSGIATFVSMESVFDGVVYLGVGLGARTAARFATSSVAPRLLRAEGPRNVLLGSQLLGLLSLLVLALGFSSGRYAVLLLGVMLTGVPTTLYSVTASALYRKELADPDAFRRTSALHRSILGASTIVAGALVPFLLARVSFTAVLALDAISYAVAGAILWTAALPASDDDGPVVHDAEAASFLEGPVCAFALKATAALLLVALVPLVAGAPDVHVGRGLAELLRPHLWVLEGIAMFAGTAAYGYLRKHPRLGSIETIALVNAIFLAPVLLDARPWVSLPAMLAVSLSAHLGFAKVRDDLVLGATSAANRARYAASVHGFESVAQTLSPVLLSLGFLRFSFPVAVAVTLGLQIVLVLLAARFGGLPSTPSQVSAGAQHLPRARK